MTILMSVGEAIPSASVGQGGEQLVGPINLSWVTEGR